jgi:hypothetical protein
MCTDKHCYIFGHRNWNRCGRRRRQCIHRRWKPTQAPKAQRPASPLGVLGQGRRVGRRLASTAANNRANTGDRKGGPPKACIFANPFANSARIVDHRFRHPVLIYDRDTLVFIIWSGETREFFHALFIDGGVLKKYRSVLENPYDCRRHGDK